MQKKIYLSLGILLLVGAGLFLAIKKQKTLPKKTPPTESATLAEKDQQVISQLTEGEKVKDLDAYAALIRQSRKKDPKVYELSLKFATSENKLYRQAVAQTMSAYENEESLNVLKSLASDPDISVRKFALRALGQHKSPEAYKYLQTQLKSLKGEELITALGASYRSTADTEQKQKFLKTLNREYKKKDKHSDLAGITLIQVGSRTEYVQKFMRTLLKNKVNSRVSVTALRTLGRQKDSWLMSQYEKIAKWGNNEVARAIIESVPRTCPKNRWKLISDIVKPNASPSLVRTAIRVMTSLPGPQADAFLEKIKANHGNKPGIAKDLEATLGHMRSGKLRNPCLP